MKLITIWCSGYTKKFAERKIVPFKLKQVQYTKTNI